MQLIFSQVSCLIVCLTCMFPLSFTKIYCSSIVAIAVCLLQDCSFWPQFFPEYRFEWLASAFTRTLALELGKSECIVYYLSIPLPSFVNAQFIFFELLDGFNLDLLELEGQAWCLKNSIYTSDSE